MVAVTVFAVSNLLFRENNAVKIVTSLQLICAATFLRTVNLFGHTNARDVPFLLL